MLLDIKSCVGCLHFRMSSWKPATHGYSVIAGFYVTLHAIKCYIMEKRYFIFHSFEALRL